MRRILITGGAGFAGSSLALKLKQQYSSAQIIAFDNLKRRGSELAIPRLKQGGVEFAHGDVRSKDDLREQGAFDLIIDCAAEPSVLAGVGGSPQYVIETNLVGTLNLLEVARIHNSAVIFLSTSRVYPIAAINALPFEEQETRMALPKGFADRGISARGVAEDFPLDGVRSMYGSSKLCSELMLEEYRASYGVKSIVNRCGVLTGPWQMGKVDQGVIVLWIAKHIFKGELSYIGYGGSGKQVRDLLHIDDLFELLKIQIENIDRFSGSLFNVGGGEGVSVSLCELTALCQQVTGSKIPIKRVPETRANDLPWYLTDNSRVTSATHWKPSIQVPYIVEEISRWITNHKIALEPILA